MADTELHPQILGHDKGTPLSSLISSAVRQSGDTPSTLDGQTILMLVEFANEIIDDIRMHAYSPPDLDLPYYEHPTQVRDIDDNVIITGLIARYAAQQLNEVRATYNMSRYWKTLNQSLYRRKHGNTPIALSVVAK